MYLNKHLLLFYTGINRFASNIASEQIKRTPQKQKELREMQSLVTDGLKIINGKLKTYIFSEISTSKNQ